MGCVGYAAARTSPKNSSPNSTRWPRTASRATSSSPKRSPPACGSARNSRPHWTPAGRSRPTARTADHPHCLRDEAAGPGLRRAASTGHSPSTTKRRRTRGHRTSPRRLRRTPSEHLIGAASPPHHRWSAIFARFSATRGAGRLVPVGLAQVRLVVGELHDRVAPAVRGRGDHDVLACRAEVDVHLFAGHGHIHD